MSYCLNPACQKPENPDETKFCQTCGSKLALKERYRTLNPIGRGGFGRTFLAIDEDKPSKPRCVIKQFFPIAQGTENVQKAAELFNQEAMRLDELGKHPQIPELFAYFIQDNQQYLVQEFIDGQTLARELAQKGAFDETGVRQLLQDLLPVLQFIHSHEVIHRDIKPDNIIRRSGSGRGDANLVLVDFGAAKVVSGAALHQAGTSIGSPEFVAPEQSRGRAVYASDIYSLGVTCVHLLTQMSPFDLYDIKEDIWVWQQYLKYPISDVLKNILNKMLDSAVSRRYQSAAEVLQDLNRQTLTVVEVKPQKPVTPAKSTAPKGKIDAELAEVKSQFLNPTASKTENQASSSQKSPKSDPAAAKSQIDRELEELRSQFLDPEK